MYPNSLSAGQLAIMAVVVTATLAEDTDLAAEEPEALSDAQAGFLPQAPEPVNAEFKG